MNSTRHAFVYIGIFRHRRFLLEYWYPLWTLAMSFFVVSLYNKRLPKMKNGEWEKVGVVIRLYTPV